MPSKATGKKAPKTEKKTEPETEPVAPVDKKTTGSKGVKSKKTESKIEPEVKQVETKPIEVENVVVSTDATTNVISDNFSEVLSKMQNVISQFTALKTEIRSLEKKALKELRVAHKLNNKKKRKGTRAPSGFVKPAPISDELAGFLSLPTGSEMARTDVTREINKYIREHQLQNKTNGRIINPDDKLSKLLKVENDVELTYFNLQKYMGPHFPKQIKPVAVA
jgi:upstream activation factor subunit UAF30